MIDFHSHILAGVDDGCKETKESVEVLRKLKELGFSKIVLTPHFIEKTEYQADNKTKLKQLKKLKTELKKEKIDLELVLGNEIFLSEEIEKEIDEKKVCPIFGKYLLVEMAKNGNVEKFLDSVYELQLKDYKIILAHPERYDILQKNREKIKKLKRQGVLFQANYGSFLGNYGKKAKKTAKFMLKNHYIDFFGTDIHSSDSKVLKKFRKIERKIIRIAGKKYYKEIVNNE